MFCGLIERRIEREIDSFGRVRSGVLLRHLEGCSRCGEYHELVIEAGKKLRGEAACEVNEFDLELIRSRVMGSVKRGNTAACAAARRQRTFYFSITAAAALFVLAGVLFLSLSSETVEPQAVKEVVYNGQGGSEAVVSSDYISSQLGKVALFPERSVESEMDKLLVDASKVASFFERCTPLSFMGSE